MHSVEKTILLTGGAGFIGSHLAVYLTNQYPQYRIVNVDALTYAGNLNNLTEVQGKSNYQFIQQNINDALKIKQQIRQIQPDWIIHLAAESHVDRSIENPNIFAETNILGTLNLLESAREIWKEKEGKLFYQISTDEVYGSLALDSDSMFSETTPYAPRSPYAASKAAADHMVSAFANTYGLPTITSFCSNNYGPKQMHEKLIPQTIKHIIEKKPIPVYGLGENVRDWIYVEDHVAAIDLIAHKGKRGAQYNVGANNEQQNINVVKSLCELLEEHSEGARNAKALISFVKDRPGHDERYAIDASKINQELGWQAETPFKDGLEKTVKWYLKEYGS